MKRFLLKGIIRDKSRSLLPVTVVAIGVFFFIFIDGFFGGTLNNMIDATSRYKSGHLKVTTRVYHDNEEQRPLDMALLEVDELIEGLKTKFPDVDWNPRILFGGLLDIPDSQGETKAQGPVMATAYDLLSPQSHESQRLHLEKAITSGRTIQHPMEVLVSYDFAEKFGVQPGNTVTFFGSTMYGSMSFTNFTVAGVVRFGMSALDRGAVIIDLADARQLLDMDNAANEVLGFFPHDAYDDEQAEAIKTVFNAKYADSDDEYAPVMLQFADQNSMRETLIYFRSVTGFIVLLLVLALSIVLWNTGILGGIRRYNEFGVRLALGETKSHIYRTLLIESLFIGFAGSVIGTALGLLLSLYLKNHGIDYGSMLDNVNMMLDPVIRSEISPRMFYIGFIPGIVSMLIGTALSGIAVYKRNTAMLFKELD